MIETTCRIRDLKPGDMVDLEGDPFADPGGENTTAHGFDCELATVMEVDHETPACTAIGFEGFDIVGFPPDHTVPVRTDDEG